jgi:ethanolamine utilization microcompartment shell protein EutL
MAQGTITRIVQNDTSLTIEITINGAIYSANVSLATFNALPDNAAKQAYIITIIADSRRVNKQYENAFPSFIGTIVTVPD